MRYNTRLRSIQKALANNKKKKNRLRFSEPESRSNDFSSRSPKPLSCRYLRYFYFLTLFPTPVARVRGTKRD